MVRDLDPAGRLLAPSVTVGVGPGRLPVQVLGGLWRPPQGKGRRVKGRSIGDPRVEMGPRGDRALAKVRQKVGLARPVLRPKIRLELIDS